MLGTCASAHGQRQSASAEADIRLIHLNFVNSRFVDSNHTAGSLHLLLVQWGVNYTVERVGFGQ